jgi:hypothetical protein
LVNRLKLPQRLLDLTYEAEVRRSSHELVDRLREAIWHLLPSCESPQLWSFLDDRRTAFIEAARRELHTP